MQRRPLAALCAVICAALLLLHALGMPLSFRRPDDAFVTAEAGTPVAAEVTGYVKSAERREDAVICILRDVQVVLNSNTYKISNIRVTLKGSSRPPAGSLLAVSGLLSLLPSPTNPGGYDSAARYENEDILYRLSARSMRVLSGGSPIREGLWRLRERLCDRIGQVYPEDAAGVAAAMLTGERRYLTDHIRNRFRMGGIAHMLAISGMHITLIAQGLLLLCKKCRMPARAAEAVSALCLIAFAVFTGASVSTVRAVIMFLICLGAGWVGRTADTLTSLSAAALLMLAERPALVLDPAFQMSCIAVAAMACLKNRSRLFAGLILTLVMAPVAVSAYYQISFAGVLINLMVVPALPLFLIFALAGTLFGGIAALPLVVLLSLVDAFAGAVSRLPFACLICGKPEAWQMGVYVLLLTGFLCLYRKLAAGPWRFALLFLLPILLLPLRHWPSPNLRMTFLDVGQGDSIVIECPGGGTAVVDTGSSTKYNVGSTALAAYLMYRGIDRIDYLIASHMDSDHINGIEELLALRDGMETPVRVDTVVLPLRDTPTEDYVRLVKEAEDAGARVMAVSLGDEFVMGQCVFSFLGPDERAAAAGDENEGSAVMALTYGHFNALLTGDIAGGAEQALTRRLTVPDESFELLKVAHHGSRFSTPKVFLEKLSPRVGVISCGRDNWYGHPHGELLSRLKAAGCAVYRTDEDGAILVETDGRTFSVSGYVRNEDPAIYPAA